MSRTRINTLIGSAAFAALLMACRVMAAQPIYNTERVLQHNDLECTGVPACRPVESPPLVINIDQVKVLAVNCPASHPFAWHWDTQQHEHLYVKLVGRTRTGLTLSVSNRADAPGECQIFIGCSPQPFAFAGAGFMRSRTGVPSSGQTFEDGSPQERSPQ
jgi:hypothetical protein